MVVDVGRVNLTALPVLVFSVLAFSVLVFSPMLVSWFDFVVVLLLLLVVQREAPRVDMLRESIA